MVTSRDIKSDESSILTCSLDIVVTNNVGIRHDACEEVEPPMSEEATRIENDIYQPLESTSRNVLGSKRHVNPTKIQLRSLITVKAPKNKRIE